MTHPSSASHGVEDVYRAVISDVITNLRETFLDENVDVDILQQLKKEWEEKVTKSGAVNIDTSKNLQPPAMRQPPSKVPQQHQHQQQQQHAANPQPIAAAPSAFVQPSTSNTLPQQSALHSTAHLPSSSSAFVIQGQPPQQQQLPAAMGIGQATLPIQPQQVIRPGPGGFYLQQANQFLPQQTLLLNPQTGLSQHLTPQQQQQLFFAAAASGQPQAILQQLDPKSKKEVAQLDGGPGMTDSSSSEEDEEEDDSIKQFIGMQEQGAEEGDGVEEDPLNSNDDQSDEEDLETLFDSENVVVCQFEKVNRARSKWKFILKDGIMHLNGNDYCFQKVTGEAECSQMSDENEAEVRRRRVAASDEDPDEANGGLETRKKAEKPIGSRSRWSQASYFERVVWVMGVPLRAILCVSNVTVFFVTYFGFMVTVLWARYLWPRFYWYYEGKLYLWLQGFIGYWGYTADYDVYEYGDDITSYGDSDRVLVLINHQSTADVPTLFTALQQKGVATRKTLWLMDVMFRWTPFGVIGRMHGDYFIQQGKATRDRELVRLKAHLEKVFWDRDRRWVIMFPEGGFYYKRVESSQKYARENGFPHLKHTTLPRMGAVKVILDTLGPRREESDSRESSSSSLHHSRSGNHIKLLKDTVGAIREKRYVKETRPPIKYVLDVTIAYPNGHPLSLATLIFGNRENCDIAVNYKMYRASEVPFHDEIQLRDWMYKVYQEKDELLDRYYKWGTFAEGERGQRIVFPWSRIIGQYAFWFGSFFLQMKFYSYLVSKLYHFFFP